MKEENEDPVIKFLGLDQFGDKNTEILVKEYFNNPQSFFKPIGQENNRKAKGDMPMPVMLGRDDGFIKLGYSPSPSQKEMNATKERMKSYLERSEIPKKHLCGYDDIVKPET